MYEFSAPMPNTKDDINRLLDINKEVKESKITSLYNTLPSNCELFTGFEQARNFAFEYSGWEYWKQLIAYTLESNCEFIYLLNNPRPLAVENSDFLKQLEKLDILLNELKKLGVKKLRIASAQLSSYIGEHYKNFEILASTSLEYKTICEYQNLIYFHKEVKQIVPSSDINKNFKLLTVLKKSYPNIQFELMVNEGCLKGCPNRILHEMISIDTPVVINNDVCLSNSYAAYFCNIISKKYPIQNFVINTNIFPWEIKQYKNIGITNFKFTGRENYYYYFEELLNAYRNYLKGVDDIKLIKNCDLGMFTQHFMLNKHIRQLKIKDYKKYLPEIKHFKKYGHLCASKCGVECKYCYKCAEKIQKVFEKKQEEQRKRMIPVCVIGKN